MYKLDLKYAYFSVPLEKKDNLFASVGQETCTSSCAFALVWEQHTHIPKIVKSAQDNLTQDKHQNNNLLRRHDIDGSLFRRDTHDTHNTHLS